MNLCRIFPGAFQTQPSCSTRILLFEGFGSSLQPVSLDDFSQPIGNRRAKIADIWKGPRIVPKECSPKLYELLEVLIAKSIYVYI